MFEGDAKGAKSETMVVKELLSHTSTFERFQQLLCLSSVKITRSLFNKDREIDVFRRNDLYLARNAGLPVRSINMQPAALTQQWRVVTPTVPKKWKKQTQDGMSVQLTIHPEVVLVLPYTVQEHMPRVGPRIPGGSSQQNITEPKQSKIQKRKLHKQYLHSHTVEEENVTKKIEDVHDCINQNVSSWLHFLHFHFSHFAGTAAALQLWHNNACFILCLLFGNETSFVSTIKQI